LHIRPLSAEDASTFQALRLAALQESPTAFSSSFDEEVDRTLMQVASFLAGSPERVILGAFTGQQLIGIVGVGREAALKERHRGFIRSMYVSPQGRGRGVGTALLQQALAVASEWAGVEQLTLAVTAGNEPAIAVYLNAGFVEYGRAPRALCIGDAYYDEVQMVWHRRAA
jgi:RimJ/RimL family protein N-acetyltransferase